ncbi:MULTISPECIES: PucR family transcriptional regulator [unclassified Microbacterium]|uniref:PucR family transcriptional regulator n=1 Tax=unclassified Microbacterium TaxID=2609290 RepID=UPI00204130C3|nr:helix-turn-helix domain-containing protein [Microbacterium sp. USTB-Y]
MNGGRGPQRGGATPGGADAGRAAEPTTTELLAVVAGRLDARLPEIVRDMRDHLATRIDDLGGDPLLVEMLQSSIEGNVATICHVLANDIGIESLQPTTAAVEYAVRLAQRDVSLGALTRAYYLGQSMLLRLALDEVEHLDVSESARMEVVRGVAETIHRYIDWILQYVSTVHDTERRRWWSARATLNASTVLKVLRGDEVGEKAFAGATTYELAGSHLALISWVDGEPDNEAQQRMDTVIRRIAGLLRSPRPPLTSAADGATAWAWIAGAGHRIDDVTRAGIDDLVASSGGIRVAFGLPGSGTEGFRRSHEQAATARLIALGTRRYARAATVGYDDPDVAVLALLTKDPAATRAWIAETLGTLAAPGSAAQQIRDTLRVYYATGENHTRTATELGLHRNTVRQRVARFQSERAGRSTDPLEIALALRVHEALREGG